VQLRRLAEQLVFEQAGQGLLPALPRQAWQRCLVPRQHGRRHHHKQFPRGWPFFGLSFEALCGKILATAALDDVAVRPGADASPATLAPAAEAARDVAAAG
jgi:hypothetical protein